MKEEGLQERVVYESFVSEIKLKVCKSWSIAHVKVKRKKKKK